MRFVLAATLVSLLPAVGPAFPQGTLIPEVIAIPAGPFIAGSDRAERESAYRLDETAYGHSVTRKQGWYEHERDRGEAVTGAYTITRTLVTNAQYGSFVTAELYPKVGDAMN